MVNCAASRGPDTLRPPENQDDGGHCLIRTDNRFCGPVRTKNWLDSQGVATSDMQSAKILRADTGSQGFPEADLTVLDSMKGTCCYRYVNERNYICLIDRQSILVRALCRSMIDGHAARNGQIDAGRPSPAKGAVRHGRGQQSLVAPDRVSHYAQVLRPTIAPEAVQRGQYGLSSCCPSAA